MIFRISTILLALHLVFVTGGVVLSKHYCAGQLDSISIFFADDEKTCGCENGSGNCCSTETEHIQLEDDFNFSPLLTVPSVQANFVGIIHSFTSLVPLNLRHTVPKLPHLKDTSPPGIATSIYLIVRSLRL